LEKFLVSKSIMSEVDWIKYWVILVGFSNHYTIILQMDRQNDKPSNLYKFNT
jgi:hypothetical protein